MSGKIIFLLLFAFLFPLTIYAGGTPIVEVVTSSTGTNIDATVLSYLPLSGRLDLKNFTVTFPGSAVTGLTQKTPNATSLYLFSLNFDRTIWESRADFTQTTINFQPPKKFGIMLSELYPAMQLTQFTNPLAVTTFNKDQYRAFFLNSNGLYAHRSAQIFPSFTPSFSGGISNDGRFVWASGMRGSTYSYGIQPLNSHFQRVGNPMMINTSRMIISGDITGELPGGQRLFVFREAGPVTNGKYPTRIAIQLFDSVNYKLIGSPYRITNFTLTPLLDAERMQSVAISPRGFGVAYSIYSTTCDKEILRWRFLGTNYKPLGTSKLLLGCSNLNSGTEGVFGFDILPINLRF